MTGVDQFVHVYAQTPIEVHVMIATGINSGVTVAIGNGTPVRLCLFLHDLEVAKNLAKQLEFVIQDIVVNQGNR